MKDPKIFVALDYGSAFECVKVMKSLEDIDGIGFKINQDFVVMNGMLGIMAVRSNTTKPLFVDLKMWNGKRTMLSTLNSLEDCGVDYTNIYGLADSDVLEYLVNNTKKIKILGLTVLTHYDEEYCQKTYRCSLAGTVMFLAGMCRDAGCHGVILPTTMLETTQDLQGIKRVCPGIRPVWYGDSRHKQQMTPKEALDAGADMLVIGSPITKANNPREALLKILKEIE